MGLFSRSAAVTIALAPDVVTPRQLVTATVKPTRRIDKVSSATLQWGYTNFYRYHWAGRVDSVAAAANDTLYHLGEVGTNAGGDRDTDDWISVTEIALPVPDGHFDGGGATFRVPSWAPASSKEIASWGCRLVIDRAGRDIDTTAEFTVRVGRADVAADDGPLEVVMGAGETVIDIALSTPVCTAGSPILGAVTLTPTKDLPDGDIAVCWQRHRQSHPLTRTPTSGGSVDGPIVKLGNKIALRAGSPITIPFEIALPADAAPTASAVNSSIRWYVAARLFYAGFSAHLPERVIRPIVVVNAV